MAHDPLDEQLAAADPSGEPGPEVRGALDALREEILDMSTSTPIPGPFRRKRALIAVGACAALGLGATAAAADGFFARTGLFGSGGEDGTGEMIRLDAPDADEVVAGLGGDIPLPPGVSLTDLGLTDGDEPSQMSESGVRGALELNAACRWTAYWLEAEAAGDPADMAAAQAVLDDVPGWEALVASDPTLQPSDGPTPPADAPVPLDDQGDAVGSGNGGVVAMWQDIAEAAADGDRQAVLDRGYTVNCTDVTPGR